MYLVALERTWLAYNRTANQLASHGFVVAQVLFLHGGKHRVLGKACCAAMIVVAILVTLLGLVRYTRQARALSPGAKLTVGASRVSATSTAITPSSYVMVAGLTFGTVCVMLFVCNLIVE